MSNVTAVKSTVANTTVTKEHTMSNPTEVKTTKADKKLAAVAKKINAAPKADKAEAKKGSKKAAKSSEPRTTADTFAPSSVAEDTSKKIKVLVDENPKREGSESAKRFAFYKNGMTIAAALEKGVTVGDIRWDVKHEYIALSK